MVLAQRLHRRAVAAWLVLTLAMLLVTACSQTTPRKLPSTASRGPVGEPTGPGRAFPQPRWIAHALGRVEGWPIANCRECFEASYRRGYRYLEADFVMTSDGALAVVHDGLEAALGLPTPFTLEQFMKVPLLGGLHSLDGGGLAALLATHEDCFLVTDFKTGNEAGLPLLVRACEAARVDWRRRVIPQVHSAEQVELVESLGFSRAILTLYRFGNRPREALAVAQRTPAVFAVTMPVSWFRPALASDFRSAGKLLLVHTVNEMARAQELFDLGVDGIYTDVLID